MGAAECRADAVKVLGETLSLPVPSPPAGSFVRIVKSTTPTEEETAKIVPPQINLKGGQI